MPRQDRNVGSKTTPHFDGEQENIIQDSLGKQMGIRMDMNEDSNPFDVTKLKNKEMEEFKKFTKGKNVDP